VVGTVIVAGHRAGAPDPRDGAGRVEVLDMSLLLREAIGGTIRRARTERRRTLRDVSHSARVSLGYLSEIERGRKEPSSELLAAICEALALPLPDLLDDVAEALRPAATRPRRLVAAPAGVDPALRTAVEEAFEDALEPDADAVAAPPVEPAPEPATAGEAAAAPEAAAELAAGERAGTDETTGDEHAGEATVRLVPLVTVGAVRPAVVASAA
jgi:transcriptional regulator with XRE-family HTH domain